MAFTEDLGSFFDTGDFAVMAKVTKTDSSTTEFPVHFNMPQEVVDLHTGNITLDAHSFMCQTDDLTGVVRGNAVEIDSVSYTIERLQTIDDGKLTEVFLRT